MENPQNLNGTPTVGNKLTHVTPVSKYLALILFTLLPFLGGYVGYKYAPIKIVETEKTVVEEVPANNPNYQREQSSLPMTENIQPMNEETCAKQLPELKERLFAEHDQTQLENMVYSNVSDIKTYFSPTLNTCIYTLREINFISRKDGNKEYTNTQAKIYKLDTDEELFSIIIETVYDGEVFEAYKNYTSKLDRYLAK